MTRPLLSMIACGVAATLSVNAVRAGEPAGSRFIAVKPITTTAAKARQSDRVALVNGAITGTISGLDPGGVTRPLSQITVSFYRHGALAAQVLPGPDGNFVARLSPGFYTLVAYGPSGYCTFGMEAVADGTGQGTMQVNTLAIPPSDFEATYMLSRRYAMRSMIGPAPMSMPTPAMDLIPREPPVEDGAGPETSLSQHTVRVDPDGSVPGRLNLGNGRARSPMNAFLVQNGAVVKQAAVAADGSFRFSGVAPGTYSFITAGAAGFSAFGVVVGAPSSLHASLDR